VVMSPVVLEPENDCAGETMLSSKRMLHEDYNQKCSVGIKNVGHVCQGACHQDRLIGGKSPVIK
jgi:hypothetical protein